jgi:hypothetical protein
MKTCISALLVLAAFAAMSGHSRAADLTTLVSFNGTDGAFPEGRLIANSNGNLFGTTSLGGTSGDGTVFEIVKTATGYASTPTTLVSFSGPNGNGEEPLGLIADVAGNLFGTTVFGGEFPCPQIPGPTGFGVGCGTAYEVVKTASGYASTPTTLVNFNFRAALPTIPLIADVNGNLFGTTRSFNTIFEIEKTTSGYASTPTTLVSFGNTDGFGLLDLIDANGNLFGTTSAGGTSGDGTVFEIVKTATGYASTPTTLVSFSGPNGNGSGPYSLIADANGNLFGTTTVGGASGDGTVFEIVKTASGYASTPTTLVSFNGTNGSQGGLIADAVGNLFGTTVTGGGSSNCLTGADNLGLWYGI